MIQRGGSHFLVRLRGNNLYMVIKPFDPPNVEDVIKLFQCLPREELLIYKTDVEKTDTPEAWFLNPYYKKDVNLVAKINHEVVAEGTLHSEGIYWKEAAELRIVIHPHYRKMGVGRTLVRALIQEGIRLGFKKIVIRHKPKNVGIMKIFQSLGIYPESSVKLFIQEDVSEVPEDMVVTLFNLVEWGRRYRNYLTIQTLCQVTG